jgi:hypothetical protein
MSLQAPQAPAFVRELLGASPARLTAFAAAYWPHLVGDEIASRTRVVKVENGTLVVEVPDASWRRELHRLQGSLLGRLRGPLGGAAPRRLGFIEARGGVSRLPARPAHPAESQPQPNPPSAAILEAARSIPDPALREAFVQTAARYLAAKGKQ